MGERKWKRNLIFSAALAGVDFCPKVEVAASVPEPRSYWLST
jgi:hypothetical protein